jgi:hypothetical protein
MRRGWKRLWTVPKQDAVAEIEPVELEVRMTEYAVQQLRSAFDAVQAQHILSLARALKDFRDPWEEIDALAGFEIERLATALPLKAFDPLFVLHDRGGPLRTKSVQVVFGVIPKLSRLVVFRVYSRRSALSPGLRMALIDLYRDYIERAST